MPADYGQPFHQIFEYGFPKSFYNFDCLNHGHDGQRARAYLSVRTAVTPVRQAWTGPHPERYLTPAHVQNAPPAARAQHRGAAGHTVHVRIGLSLFLRPERVAQARTLVLLRFLSLPRHSLQGLERLFLHPLLDYRLRTCGGARGWLKAHVGVVDATVVSTKRETGDEKQPALRVQHKGRNLRAQLFLHKEFRQHFRFS